MREALIKTEDEFKAFVQAHKPGGFKEPLNYPVKVRMTGFTYTYEYPSNEGLVWLNRLKEVQGNNN